MEVKGDAVDDRLVGVRVRDDEIPRSKTPTARGCRISWSGKRNGSVAASGG
jgi:hypothetical protein